MTSLSCKKLLLKGLVFRGLHKGVGSQLSQGLILKTTTMIIKKSQKHMKGHVLCLFGLKMVVVLFWLPQNRMKAMLMLKEISKLFNQEQCHHMFNVACLLNMNHFLFIMHWLYVPKFGISFEEINN